MIMKILHLVLMGKWYDLIASGEKTEEYRALTPYWCNRLIQRYGIDYWKGIFEHNSIDKLVDKHNSGIPAIYGFNGVRSYDTVCFHCGYTNTTMSFEYETLDVGKGKQEWGAPEEPVFIIKLGKRL